MVDLGTFLLDCVIQFPRCWNLGLNTASQQMNRLHFPIKTQLRFNFTGWLFYRYYRHYYTIIYSQFIKSILNTNLIEKIFKRLWLLKTTLVLLSILQLFTLRKMLRQIFCTKRISLSIKQYFIQITQKNKTNFHSHFFFSLHNMKKNLFLVTLIKTSNLCSIVRNKKKEFTLGFNLMIHKIFHNLKSQLLNNSLKKFIYNFISPKPKFFLTHATKRNSLKTKLVLKASASEFQRTLAFCKVTY